MLFKIKTFEKSIYGNRLCEISEYEGKMCIVLFPNKQHGRSCINQLLTNVLEALGFPWVHY